jgi:hypothetical protein
MKDYACAFWRIGKAVFLPYFKEFLGIHVDELMKRKAVLVKN